MKLPPPSSSTWPARSWMGKVQIKQLNLCWMARRHPVTYWLLTGHLFGTFEVASIKWEIIIAVLRCLSDCLLAYYAQSCVRSCRRHWNREKMAGDGTYDNTVRLCIHVLPVPPVSVPCASCVLCVVSMRRAINSITGDTFWKPVTGWKPINRLTSYRFNKLI